jgi:hypothetical protein
MGAGTTDLRKQTAMSFRLTICLLVVGLSGCADHSPPMWSGPDLSLPLSSVADRSALPPSLSLSNEQAPPPALSRRAGSGTPPALLRGTPETVRPPSLAPLTMAPATGASPPSPLDGPGFQRTGPITYGPGAVYNSVGTTIFGPGGKVCTPVGTSLTCL